MIYSVLDDVTGHHPTLQYIAAYYIYKLQGKVVTHFEEVVWGIIKECVTFFALKAEVGIQQFSYNFFKMCNHFDIGLYLPIW